jgi:hypothetical protein
MHRTISAIVSISTPTPISKSLISPVSVSRSRGLSSARAAHSCSIVVISPSVNSSNASSKSALWPGVRESKHATHGSGSGGGGGGGDTLGNVC